MGEGDGQASEEGSFLDLEVLHAGWAAKQRASGCQQRKGACAAVSSARCPTWPTTPDQQLNAQ